MKWPESAREQMVRLRQSGIPLSRITRSILSRDRHIVNRAIVGLAGGFVALSFVSAMAVSLVGLRPSQPSRDMAELVAASVPVAQSAVPPMAMPPAPVSAEPEPEPAPPAPVTAEAAPNSAPPAPPVPTVAKVETVSLTETPAPQPAVSRTPPGAKTVSVTPAVATAPAAVASVPVVDCAADLAIMANRSSILFPPGVKDVTGVDLVRALNIARSAADCPDIRITVAGYSDASGNPDDNMRLSWYRAESVVAAIEAAGFDTAAFDAVGYGSRRAGPAQTETGASDADRRVDFIVSRVPLALTRTN